MNAEDLIGQEVLDNNGDKIGKVQRVYVTEDENRRPEWVTVKTGLLGGNETFVPLSGSSESQHGIQVATDKQTVKNAPATSAEGRLSQEESAELYRHYGMDASMRGGMGAGGQGERGQGERGQDEHGRGAHGEMRGQDEQAGGMPPQQRSDAGAQSGKHASSTRGRSGEQEQEQEMVRSEERLQVDKETVESGRAKLTKHVVTEEQQMSVPVRREEVRIEREPISDPNSVRDADIGESEQEVVLHEERATVHKETVPVERVRIGTETVTDEQTVGGEVRKEEVEISDPTDEGKRRKR